MMRTCTTSNRTAGEIPWMLELMHRIGSSHRAVPAALLLLLASTGCSRSGGSDHADTPPVTATNNLSLTGLEITTLEPRVGYPLDLITRIDTQTDVEDVSVSYYALNQEDIDSRVQDIRQFFLGTATFPLISNAVLEYPTQLSLPPGIDPPGDYVIRAVVDPAGLVAETHEDDNTVDAVASMTASPNPNLFIESLALDSIVVLLHPDGDGATGITPDTGAGATLVTGIEGTQETVDAEAFVYLRITRPDLPAGANSRDVPINLWDSSSQTYLDASGIQGPPQGLPLGTLFPQDQSGTAKGEPIEWTNGNPPPDLEPPSVTNRRSLHLDLRFSRRLVEWLTRILPEGAPDSSVLPPGDMPAATLQALMDFVGDENGVSVPDLTFTIVAKVRATDSRFHDENPDDDVAVSQELILVRAGELSSVPEMPLAFEQGDQGSWVNTNFGIGYAYDATASVDSRGGKAAVAGVIPVTLLGHTFNMVEFHATAQVVPQLEAELIPDGENSGFFLTLDVLTDPNVPPPGSGISLLNVDQPLGFLFPDPEAQPGDWNHLPEWSISQEATYSAVFFVGPVPVTVTGGIGGSIGFELHANLQPTQLIAEAGPFAQLEATITGGIGIPALNAGFGGALTLIDERFTGRVETYLVVCDFGDLSGQAVFHGIAHMQVYNTLTGPAGRLFLQATYPGITWCNVAGFVFPCGVKITHLELVLVEWVSFVHQDILFDQTLCKQVTIDANGVVFSDCQAVGACQ